MNKNLLTIAEAYYVAMGKKDSEALEKYLHPDVHFKAPLAESTGKQAYLEATKGFMGFFKTLTIRATCVSANQATVVYDLDFPAPIGKLSSVALLTFHEGLITNIELFYDARPFEKK